MGEQKSFDSISPTAAWLLRLKSFTTIPFVREAATLLGVEKKEAQLQETDRGKVFRLLIHFENRYRAIEKILSHIELKNVMELTYGFSFRGLDLCLEKNIHFIDTDLPGVIEQKKSLISILSQNKTFKGQLECLPLNV